MDTAPRIPCPDELTGAIRDATHEELLALSTFAAWAAANQTVLTTGRRHGICFGVTPEVAAFIRLSLPSPAAGDAVIGNLLPIPA